MKNLTATLPNFLNNPFMHLSRSRWYSRGWWRKGGRRGLIESSSRIELSMNNTNSWCYLEQINMMKRDGYCFFSKRLFLCQFW